jgi:hypothetical protein
VKIRPLPDLDLARIAPLDRAKKRAALRQQKDGFPPLSLNPMRLSTPDILSVNPGPLAALQQTPWATVEEAIAKGCRSSKEASANLAAGSALYRYAQDKQIFGRYHEFFPLAIGVNRKVVYWSNAVLAIDGKPHAVFVDPRRTRRLTAIGRRFVFSVMNERIRVADPDFADVGLAIVQFDNPEQGPRTAHPWFDQDVALYSFEELDAMVRETYEVWTEVLAEREVEARRTAYGRRGSLL